MSSLLHLLFFLSGLAALIYEVAWVRSLGLVFGGSHVAVTTVLSVFMGGLALGGALLGARADRARNPLRLYAAIEIGIGVSAALFQVLLQAFPAVHPAAVRVVLAALGMIVPTTLIGGTLPVLSVRGRLASLYAFNTLGAVAGTLLAGFVLLPGLGVTRTVAVGVGINLLIGAVAWRMQARDRSAEAAAEPPREDRRSLSHRLVLLGIGVSGFCALGYEVLWTRVLTLVVGTSVYSFTILLAAFLAGIAAGGESAPLVARLRRGNPRFWPAVFATSQILIGLTALAVTWALREVPHDAVRLRNFFRAGTGEFGAQQVATFVVAFSFLAVPAFFMGLAFPAAGNVHAAWRGRVGRAVGEVVASNTFGSILGAAVTGFVLLYLFGFERSLHLLIVANLAIGLAVLASLLQPPIRRAAVAAVGAATLMATAALVAWPEWGRAWDRKFFAVFRNNQYQAFDTDERIQDALANTDVLYFFEGANETISVIRPKGGEQAFIVNGRVEASTTLQDRQCQRALGHLPMLLHPDPRRVFVLGTGTGMTLGATTLHPEAERIVLAEIEPGVLPATRTFAAWNHRALDDPRVSVVFDDGRNWLRSTEERFDVITADPIHPWSGGASYLYTDEYFRLASGRLRPGGVICQWLPIYELDEADLRSVVRTFANNFRHVRLWLTHYDAELIGSNDPILVDEASIGRRLERSPLREDLEEVGMGSARDLLSWFVAGDEGLRAFAREGVLNTDDNLWLEFHAPRSRMLSGLEGRNVLALTRHRDGPGGEELEAARLYDRAHALFLSGAAGSGEFSRTLAALRERHPGYAPGRFIAGQAEERRSREPRLRGEGTIAVRRSGAPAERVVLSVVTQRIGPSRGVLMAVDNGTREVYAEQYLDAADRDLEEILEERSLVLLTALRHDAATRPQEEWRRRIASLLRAP